MDFDFKHHCIINPKAGDGSVKKDFALLHSEFEKRNIFCNFHFTEYAGHASKLVPSLVSDNERNSIIIIGGDGTVNEVINGIMTLHDSIINKITLATVPSGTGNDHNRSLGMPDNPSDAIEIISKYLTIKQDVGKISFSDSEKFFINVAGMGFDANVAYNVNHEKLKNKSGKYVYFKSLISSLVHSSAANYHITLDDELINADFFSIAVGIGRYNGGGMMQLPSALIDDNLFDITLIKKISKFEVIREAKNLYDGSFIAHPAVIRKTGRTLDISADRHVLVETEGEVSGKLPCKIEILNKRLSFICAESAFVSKK